MGSGSALERGERHPLLPRNEQEGSYVQMKCQQERGERTTYGGKPMHSDGEESCATKAEVK